LSEKSTPYPPPVNPSTQEIYFHFLLASSDSCGKLSLTKEIYRRSEMEEDIEEIHKKLEKKKIRKDLYKGYNSIERDDFIAVIDNSIGDIEDVIDMLISLGQKVPPWFED
jgi:hypothetical protein